MSERTLLIANWKMHFTVAEATQYAGDLATGLPPLNGVDIVICPHFLALAAVRRALAGSGIRIGAQDAHWADQGAHTGQISASMLRGIADYAIIGHSETRQQQGVDDEMVSRKLAAVLANGLQAIVCIGESEAEYQAGRSPTVVRSQIQRIFARTASSDLDRIVIAYEPIWAIGTGHTPESNEVNQLVNEAIRAPLSDHFGESAAGDTRVLYGGSVSPSNLAQFIGQPQINGALIGGASLKRDQFIALAQIAQNEHQQ